MCPKQKFTKNKVDKAIVIKSHSFLTDSLLEANKSNWTEIGNILTKQQKAKGIKRVYREHKEWTEWTISGWRKKVTIVNIKIWFSGWLSYCV